MGALGAIGLLVLLAHVAVWGALVVALASRPPRWRGAVAAVLPPLGALWAWEAGLRRRAIAYFVTLGAFGLLVTAINIAR